MDFINNDDKNYWEQILIKRNREGGNSIPGGRKQNNPKVFSHAGTLVRKSGNPDSLANSQVKPNSEFGVK